MLFSTLPNADDYDYCDDQNCHSDDNPNADPILESALSSLMIVIITMTIKIVCLILISDDENCYSDDDEVHCGD